MAYRLEKNGDDYDIVIDGFENGIAASPHKGIGNMQGVDISTETKEVMVSYARTQQSQQKITGGTLTQVSSSLLAVSATTPLNSLPVPGWWIHIVSSSIANLTANTNYFVYAITNGQIQLSTAYDPAGSLIINTFGAGTATFISIFDLAQVVQTCTEFYTDSSHVQQQRYYALDANGRLWVYDTALTSLWKWSLPSTSVITTPALGLGFLNGFIFIFGSNAIYTVSSVQLKNGATLFVYASAMTGVTGNINPKFAYTGHQGKMYYTDGPFVGSLFPNTTLDGHSLAINVQSYGQYTSVTTTGTITALFSGSLPATSTYGSTLRIPAFFFPSPGGTNPTALTAGTKYYIDYTVGLSSSGTFEVYAGASGGSALDLATGKTGTLYFNTFLPQSSDGATTFTFTQERLTLPIFETATAITEVGNTVLVGTQSAVIYPWNQIDPTPSDIINLPESGTSFLLTVNNMAFVFCGNRGNVYVTNGSTAAPAISVPDYTSGLVEPYFTWGGVMYLRGRVWFSILDQTATHTGNCGGIWSFVPTQNFFIGQDTGLALRMDNVPADGTFNGVSTALLPIQNQAARGPQYWDFRYSSISSPTYSINFSDTIPATSAVIETDIIPTGTLLKKKTFEQVEFKLAVPTDTAGTETVAIAYRLNLKDSFVNVGTMIKESSTGYIAGYCPVNFENTQWVQLRVTLTTDGISTSSFMRLREVRLR